jgi:hypothetical protein
VGCCVFSRAREVLQRRAELQRELASLDEELACHLAEDSPTKSEDSILDLAEAANMVGEPPSTFRRRLEYRRALVSRPGQRRLRFSRVELQRIQHARLTASKALTREE